MNEENKTTQDSFIKDLKSNGERLQKLYRKLELEYDDLNEKYDDLQNAFEASCKNQQLLIARRDETYSEGFRSGQAEVGRMI